MKGGCCSRRGMAALSMGWRDFNVNWGKAEPRKKSAKREKNSNRKRMKDEQRWMD